MTFKIKLFLAVFFVLALAPSKAPGNTMNTPTPAPMFYGSYDKCVATCLACYGAIGEACVDGDVYEACSTRVLSCLAPTQTYCQVADTH